MQRDCRQRRQGLPLSSSRLCPYLRLRPHEGPGQLPRANPGYSTPTCPPGCKYVFFLVSLFVLFSPSPPLH